MKINVKFSTAGAALSIIATDPNRPENRVTVAAFPVVTTAANDRSASPRAGQPTGASGIRAGMPADPCPARRFAAFIRALLSILGAI
jgi:hypothetical protein